MAVDRSRSPATLEQRLGVAKDAVTLGSSLGVPVGFGIARRATTLGFGVASACIRTPAALIEKAVGPNLVSTGLHAADHVVGLARKATSATQDVAETITKGSLDLTISGLSLAGARDGELLRLTVGGEVADALVTVGRLVRKQTGTLAHIPSADLLAAASAWGTMQHAAFSCHSAPEHNAIRDALPENSERWLRFSVATYSAAWLSGLVEGISVAAISRARAAREAGGSPGDVALACAGIEGRVDILKFEERTSEIFAPGYLVAVDHEVGCVVIALRGTASITDALTDLICEPVSLQIGGQDGIAHGGMLQAALNLEQVLAELAVSGLLRLDGRKRIILCGHSLGAGVAALLAALWRDRNRFPGVDVKCIAFACPQVLDSLLAVAQSNHTTSVILGNDMVPRFSLATAQDLFTAMACLHDPDTYGLQSSCSTQQVLAAKSRGDLSSVAATYTEVRFRACTSGARLFPAGKLVHLKSGMAPCSIHHEAVDELRISRDMLISHMPGPYLKALQEAAEYEPEETASP